MFLYIDSLYVVALCWDEINGGVFCCCSFDKTQSYPRYGYSYLSCNIAFDSWSVGLLIYFITPVHKFTESRLDLRVVVVQISLVRSTFDYEFWILFIVCVCVCVCVRAVWNSYFIWPCWNISWCLWNLKKLLCIPYSETFSLIIVRLVATQGSHRSLKTWKVLEFENLDLRPGKSWNFCRGPWKSCNLD